MHHSAYIDVFIRQFGFWGESIQNRFFDADWSGASFEMIRSGGDIVGHYGYKITDEDYHVVEVVIAPQYQNRGIGTVVIKGAISEALKTHRSVRLQTLRKNSVVKLYRRLGFI